MAKTRQLELHLLRFLPHPLRDDFVTVGFLLTETDGGFSEVRITRDSLSNTDSEAVDVIALGSPHYSITEINRFEALRAGRDLKLPVYICLSRLVWSVLDKNGTAAQMVAAAVRFVTDTCVVVTPILPDPPGVLMTDSGKFAHYTPGNTSYGVRYGSTEECVETAVFGRLVRIEALWQ